MSAHEPTVGQVIVVGGGIAGLVATHTLKRSGVDVVVLESSDRPGGRMISDVAHGHVIEAVPSSSSLATR